MTSFSAFFFRRAPCFPSYGQTGSGKTFTMDGPPENRGVNLRSLSELFALQEARAEEMDYEFTMSYLEVTRRHLSSSTSTTDMFGARPYCVG